MESEKPERLKRLREQKINTEIKKLEKINKMKEIKNAESRIYTAAKNTYKILNEQEIEKVIKAKN